MSKVKLLLDVVEDLRSLADSVQAVADAMLQNEPTVDAEPKTPAPAPKKELTLEVIDRMGLTADECRMLEDGNVAIWFKGIYDRYTQYRRDHAILGECLPYNQFMKQLRKSDLYVCDRTVMLGDNRRKGTILDYGTLKRRCDVDGFLQAQIEPLRSSGNQ